MRFIIAFVASTLTVLALNVAALLIVRPPEPPPCGSRSWP
jgi:hypothetical protein